MASMNNPKRLPAVDERRIGRFLAISKLDALCRRNTRVLMNIKETLRLYFFLPSRQQAPEYHTKGHAARLLWLPALRSPWGLRLVGRNNQVAVQPHLQLRSFIQFHFAAFE